MTLKGPQEADAGFCPPSAPTLFLEEGVCGLVLSPPPTKEAHVSSATVLTRGHLLQLVCEPPTPASPALTALLSLQNYFRDAWNVFDFVLCLGSITDILVTEIGVVNTPAPAGPRGLPTVPQAWG